MIPHRHAGDCCRGDPSILFADGEGYLWLMVADLQAREKDAQERLVRAKKGGGHKRLRRAAERAERLTRARQRAQDMLSAAREGNSSPQEGP